MGKWLFLIVMTMIVSRTSGTAIVALVTSEKIILSADGKGTDDNKASFVTSKIKKIGNFYVVIGGLTSHMFQTPASIFSAQKSGSFSSTQIISEIVKSGSSIEKIAAEIEAKWPVKLNEYMQSLKSADKASYYQFEQILRRVPQAVFIVGNVKGVPTLYHFEFMAGEDHSNGKIGWQQRFKEQVGIQQIEPGKMHVAIYGSDQLRNYKVNIQQAHKDLKDYSIKMIEFDIVNNSSSVGYPIDCLVMPEEKIEQFKGPKN